jgi:hypothetical protein
VLDISQFLQDYDAATQDVILANYRTYPLNMRKWFYVVEQENPLGPVVTDLENTLDARRWLDEQINAPPMGSMGGGLLTFPLDRRERMSDQIFLCRFLSENDLNVHKIGLDFFRRGTENRDGTIENINQELFRPMARDLRRYFERVANDQQTEIPASDRTVTLDHNSQSYQEAVEAVDRLEELVRQTNDYDDPDDKEQKLAELDAGRRLLKPIRVRVRAVAQVLAGAIRSLTLKFGMGLINQAAHDVWDKLTTLLGPWWHLPF